MTLRILIVLCLIMDICSLKLEQCPRGYRCHKRINNRIVSRSADRQLSEEMIIEIWEPGTYVSDQKNSSFYDEFLVDFLLSTFFVSIYCVGLFLFNEKTSQNKDIEILSSSHSCLHTIKH